jgi:hypothetical protein
VILAEDVFLEEFACQGPSRRENRNEKLGNIRLDFSCPYYSSPGCTNNPTPSTPTPGQPAATAAADPLSYSNDGPAKQAIIDFVRATTDKSNPKFVPPEDRIAAFDQDAKTWVEQPICSQARRIRPRGALAPQHPGWKAKSPFKALLTDDKKAIAKLTLKDIEVIVITLATHTNMTAEAFPRSQGTGWRRRSIHASTSPTPRWCTSRCWMS